MHGFRLFACLLPVTLILAWLPPGPASAQAPIKMQVTATVPLDGDGRLNAEGDVTLVDVDGDGSFELLHSNGRRLQRVFRQNGQKLWEYANPDADPIGGLNGAYTQIAQFASVGGRLYLCREKPDGVYLTRVTAATGAVEREVRLPSPRWEICHTLAVWFADDAAPTILTPLRAIDAGLPGAGTQRVEQFAALRAYDENLNVKWTVATPDAGRWVQTIDEDRDGRSEAIMAGKYKLLKNGSIVCTLQGWPAADPVEAGAIADITSASPGLEYAGVGESGAGVWRAADCSSLWTAPVAAARHVAAGNFDPSRPGLEVVFEQQTSETTSPTIYLYTADGRQLARIDRQAIGVGAPTGNNFVDGDGRRDELWAIGNQVVAWTGATLEVLVDQDYWCASITAPAGSDLRSRCAPQGYPFDLDGDGREEIVTWGRDRIVIARNTVPL